MVSWNRVENHGTHVRKNPLISAANGMKLGCASEMIAFTKRLLTCMCFVGVAGSSTPVKAQVVPLPVEEVLNSSIFAPRVPISLSPDGQWVAFTRNRARRFRNPDQPRYSMISATGTPFELIGSDVWIANTRTGESRSITEGRGTSWSPVWAPNGESLAFYSDRGGESHLWVWEKSSGKLRQVSSARVNSGALFAGAQWTPDGRRVVVRVLPEGLNAEDLLDIVYGPREPPRNPLDDARGSARIVASQASSGADYEGKNALKHPSFDLLLSDLVIIDIATGAVRRVARGLRPYSFILSPDGSYVAVISYTQHASVASEQPLCELSLASLKTGDVKVLASGLRWNFIPPSWSPDSRSLVYGTADQESQSDVFLVQTNGEGARRLRLPPDFDMLIRCSWLWEANGQSVYFISKNALWKLMTDDWTLSKIASIPDHNFLTLLAKNGGFQLWSPGKEPVVIALVRDEHTFREGFWKIDLTSGTCTKLMEEPKVHDTSRLDGIRNGIEVSADDMTITYLAEDAQHPEDIWTLGSEMNAPRPVTKTNPKLSKYRLGESRLVTWKSLDGQSLNGALLLPTGYQEGTLYPLVAYVYGGSPMSTTLNQWGGVPTVFNMQLLATRGYAVLFPDAPQHVGSPMQDLARTVLPGVQKVVDMGIADPERLGIIGHSYGGYSTLALIEQSRQFKAAIDFSGVTNLLNSYAKVGSAGGLNWVEEGQGLMGGSPWQHRDRFIENSPFFYFDRVETPLLIIHGGSDETVPVVESHIAFGALRRLGKDVVFAEYKGEGHAPSTWTYPNRVDYCERIIAWFDKYLKGGSAHLSPP